MESYHAILWWAKGWYALLLFNVLVLISEKPVPTDVWLWINGIAVGLIVLGHWLEWRHRISLLSPPARDREPERKRKLPTVG